MKNEYSIIITTVSNKKSAKVIAELLIQKRLAACVQMFPIESIYFWKEKICEDNEIILLIKSKSILFDKISATIKEKHEYETPEIIQVPVTAGLSSYLNWIDNFVENRKIIL
ncbi:MAG: divalent-cation tolerance protein CutA [Firmicutes bacterium]|nr:divalent-cation tolerance protein CutA [Bacillota bacterium]